MKAAIIHNPVFFLLVFSLYVFVPSNCFCQSAGIKEKTIQVREGDKFDIYLEQIKTEILELIYAQRFVVYNDNLTDTSLIDYAGLLMTDNFSDNYVHRRFYSDVKVKSKLLSGNEVLFISPVSAISGDSTQFNIRLEDLKKHLEKSKYERLVTWIKTGQQRWLKMKTIKYGVNRGFENSISEIWNSLHAFSANEPIYCYKEDRFPMLSLNWPMSLNGIRNEILKPENDPIDGTSANYFRVFPEPSDAHIYYEADTRKPFALCFEFSDSLNSETCDTCKKRFVFKYDEITPYLMASQISSISDLINDDCFSNVYAPISCYNYSLGKDDKLIQNYLKTLLYKTLKGELEVFMEPRFVDKYTKSQIINTVKLHLLNEKKDTLGFSN